MSKDGDRDDESATVFADIDGEMTLRDVEGEVVVGVVGTGVVGLSTEARATFEDLLEDGGLGEFV